MDAVPEHAVGENPARARHPEHPEQAFLGELAQAKIRCGMNIALLVSALAAYRGDPSLGLDRVWFTTLFTTASAAILYLWAHLLHNQTVHPRWRIGQRVACIILDNTAITWILYFGGETLAGVYGVYLWITIGYGMRYGLTYLYGNLATSLIGFILITQLSSFWRANPSLSVGLGLALLVVPIYAAFLIKRLHQAVGDAQAAYIAKSDFVAKMSHELRTPLHGIIAMADLLSRAEANVQQKEMVRIISISSNTLLDLINRILDISKFEGSTFALQREPMNLHTVINDTVSILSPQAQGKALSFVSYIDATIEQYLMGSPRQLQEVLTNLCGNAIKFTEEGEVFLGVYRVETSSPHIVVRFDIKDSGAGIAAQHLERIFDPFFQADSSVTRKHGGTGLGTAIAKELVRLMGGEISVASQLGHGTTFSLVMRFERHTQTVNTPALSPMDIVFVGNLEISNLITDKLTRHGARVTSVPALVALDSSRDGIAPSALIIDFNAIDLPAGAIRNIAFPLNRHLLIPIVAVGSEDQREHAIAQRFNSFIALDGTNGDFARMLSTVSTLRVENPVEPFVAEIRHGVRVLVAEDNSTNQTIARLTLAEAGYQCTIVDNGEDALEALAAGEHDIAIIDMHMPGMDGLEVARMYNFSHFDPATRIPIIMMTADSRPEVVADADLAGVDKFLIKPLKPSLLIKTVSGMLAARGISAEIKARAEFSTVVLAPEQAPKLVDEAIVRELMSYMEHDDCVIFFAEFNEDANSYLATLSDTAALEDLTSLRDRMHALCGAARTVGATQLAAYARRIEYLDADEIRTHADEIYQALSLLIADSAREIERYMEPEPAEVHHS
ncbi:MAG: response regulator [Gammaproteobacteria bacterium]|nr:response regulator [Gammaproteobacteria bacterium]